MFVTFTGLGLFWGGGWFEGAMTELYCLTGPVKLWKIELVSLQRCPDDLMSHLPPTICGFLRNLLSFLTLLHPPPRTLLLLSFGHISKCLTEGNPRNDKSYFMVAFIFFRDHNMQNSQCSFFCSLKLSDLSRRHWHNQSLY